MAQITELGLKERISKEGNEYRASLYTKAGYFVAWYRYRVSTINGVEEKDISQDIRVMPQLNPEQLSAACLWLEQHQP